MSICHLCKILLPAKVMDSHLNGRKHKKAVKKAESLLTTEENSTGKWYWF